MLQDVDQGMRERLVELEAANEGLRREIDQIRRDAGESLYQMEFI